MAKGPEKQRFEFYCNKCQGWIMLVLNTAHLGQFKIKCPSCGREHDRNFVDGEMKDVWTEVKSGEARFVGPRKLVVTRDGRTYPKDCDIFEPTMAAYSKESRLEKLEQKFMEKARGEGRTITTAELWLNMGKGEMDFAVEKRD